MCVCVFFGRSVVFVQKLKPKKNRTEQMLNKVENQAKNVCLEHNQMGNNSSSGRREKKDGDRENERKRE